MVQLISFFGRLVIVAVLCSATLAHAEAKAPDKKEYKDTIRRMDAEYQNALDRLPRDANYNAGVKAIDDHYNALLSQLGMGRSITIEGWYGRGGVSTSTDKGFTNETTEDKNEREAQEAAQAEADAKAPKRKGPIGIAY